jgi:hypothetical protein
LVVTWTLLRLPAAIVPTILDTDLEASKSGAAIFEPADEEFAGKTANLGGLDHARIQNLKCRYPKDCRVAAKGRRQSAGDRGRGPAVGGQRKTSDLKFKIQDSKLITQYS